MLDFNEELAKFQPCADLEEAEENIYGKELEEIKKNKTELYKANQMIKKYNQALNYAKQGNDDLAMLQLKNVVASIPNFVDAYLLMALLSIKGENYDNARSFLDTILKIDPNNESAVEYGKEFETKVVEEEPQTTEPEKKDKKKTNTTGEYGVFGHTTTSLQLFAILYKIYMAQNENKCYSIWVKYIWKICRISGKQWYIIRQMCDFWR